MATRAALTRDGHSEEREKDTTEGGKKIKVIPIEFDLEKSVALHSGLFQFNFLEVYGNISSVIHVR